MFCAAFNSVVEKRLFLTFLNVQILLPFHFPTTWDKKVQLFMFVCLKSYEDAICVCNFFSLFRLAFLQNKRWVLQKTFLQSP